MDTRRTQFGRENTIVRKSSSVRGSLLRSLDSVLDRAAMASSSIRQWAAPATRERVALEPLDPRVLLSVTTLDPNDYTLLDNGTANEAAIVLLYAFTTAGVTAAVDSTNGGVAPAADTLNSITIDVSGAAGTTFDVFLSISGLSGSTPNVVVNGLVDGDEINLTIINESITDGVGGGALENPTGGSSGFTAAIEETNADATITSAGIADGFTATVAGNLGTTTIGPAVLAGTNGGNIAVTNTRTNSAIGLVSITGGLNLTSGGNFSVTIDAGTDTDTATASGVTIAGPITLGNNGISVVLEADGSTGSVSIANGSTIAIDGTGNVSVGNNINSNLGNVTLGTINMTGASAGSVSITTNANGNIGNVTTGGLNTSGNATGDVTINPGGTGDLGSVNLGAIVFGASNVNDVSVGNSSAAISSFTVASVTNNTTVDSDVAVSGDTIGSVTIGPVTASGTGAQIGDVTVTAAAAIGTVSIGNLSLGNDTDGSDVTVSVTSTTSIGDTTFSDITLPVGSTSNVIVSGTDLGNILVNSTWNINGNGTVGISASSVDIGTVGSNTWDINFGDNTIGAVVIDSADGIGAVTINSVDHVDPADGLINIDADDDGDTIGPIGNFVIRNAGDEATNNVAWGINSSIVAEQGGIITIAGASRGSFTATAGDNNDDSWGAIIIGQDASGAAVDNSDLTGSITANDGIASITVRGIDSQLGAFNALVTDAPGASSLLVNANADSGSEDSTIAPDANQNAAPVGALGDVTVVGRSGSFGINGSFTALDFSNFTATGGSITATIATNGNTAADRIAGTSNVGNITALDGPIAALTVTVDDGIGNIAATALTPSAGSITIGTLTADADGALDPAAIGGGVGTITASGAIAITTIDTDANNDTTNQASNNVGAIQAGASIAITTLDIGGSLPSISIVEVPSTAGDNTITITSFAVDGDLNSIATTGDSAGDNITITSGLVRGDLDTIDAGLGNLTIAALTVNGGTTSSPVAVFTDTNVDYIVAVDGTFTGGVLNYAVVFGGTNSITINDIDGTTTKADTALILATRVQGTAHTAADDSGALFNLNSFSDADGDQHSFHVIRIEGDLLGDIGGDGNLADGVPGIGGLAIANLGDLANVEIQGNWANNVSEIYALSLDEISFGSTTVSPVTTDVNDNSNGTAQDLEIYNAFAALNTQDVLISVPDGGSITKLFVGPTGALETITFTDTDGDSVINSVVIDFNSGIIGDMHLFGEDWGIEFNTSDPLNPATNASTRVIFGEDQGGVIATAFTSNDPAISFLEFSSAIGDVTVNDLDTTDLFAPNVGNISVGYVVTVDGASDLGALNGRINTTGSLVVANSGLPGAAVVPAGLANVNVEGSVGGIVTSGSIGTVTTIDTVTEATPVASANFTGFVADGSAGAVNVQGNVFDSLVVGDRSITDLGADNALGGGDDTVGIIGTPSFTSNIVVQGNLGSTAGSVTATAGPNGFIIEQLPSTITGDQVSAPDGIAIDITAGGSILSAVVSGKRILVDTDEAQADDDITGNIRAGIYSGTETGGNISGDIWSGDDIGNVAGTTVIQAFGALINGVFTGGNITSDTGNGTINITASGASAGDITSDILADGNITNIAIDAGSGSGGSLNANVVAGLDPDFGGTGGGITGNNDITADNNIGSGNTHVISSAGSQNWNTVAAGLLTDNTTDPFGGDINSDFVAGVAIGASTPIQANFNSATLSLMQNENDSISINNLKAGTVDGIDDDGSTLNDSNSNLNGTLAAAASIFIGELIIDGNAIGNNGVAGGHIAAAGLGQKDSQNSLEVSGGRIVGDLSGTFSAGLFVPADQSGNSPLNSNDLGPLQAGTVLTYGDVILGNANNNEEESNFPSELNVGRWIQSATGGNGSTGINLNELLAATESGVVSGYVPAFSVGATGQIDLNINVVGRPFVTPQTGEGNFNLNGGNASDGDAVDVSIAAFGDVDGSVDVSDSADFNFVMANVDAITGIDSSFGNPSSPGTLVPWNSEFGDLGLDITSQGYGTGGLDVEYFLAGFDYFTRLASSSTTTPGFWQSFGFGDIEGSLNAFDSDATDGLEVGDVRFALIAAGEDINEGLEGAVVHADDDIIARFGSAATDGSALFRGGVDADIVAGASGNSSISPFGDGLFEGGDIDSDILAGDDIVKAATVIPGTPATPDTIIPNPPIVTAGSTTETETYANAPLDILTFNQFNPASISAPAGSTVTLTSVTISASSNVSAGSATITRSDTTTTASGAINVTQGSTLTSSLINGGSLLIDNNVSAPLTLAIGDASETVTIPSDTTVNGSVPATGLGNFTGSGTFTVNVTKSQTPALTGDFQTGGNGLTFLGGVFSGSVTITYNYTISTPQAPTVIPGNPGTPEQVIGDQIVNIAAIGSEVEGTGNINGDIRSGLQQQLNGPDLFNNGDDEQGDIYAFIVAGDSVNGDIDAGDVSGRGNNAAGNFTGGVWAGAGVDLDIFTTADNSPDGSINGVINVAGTLDARDYTATTAVGQPPATPVVMGIYAENDIHDIYVGWNINGGNLLGNVVAEGDIDQIEVWGNVGASGQNSVIFAGGNISELIVGNPSGFIGDLRPESLYTSTVGDLFADVYAGGQDSDDDDTHIHLGGSIQSGSTVILGANFGVEEARIEQAGREVSYEFEEGRGVFVFNGSNLGTNGPDIYAYGGDDDAVELVVDGDGAAASIGNLVVVADLDFLHVTKGTVGSITVNDDYNVKAELDAAVAPLNLGQFPFLTNSLLSVRDIEYYAGDDKEAVDLDTVNVDGNIGDISVQGSLTGSITSEHGSIGDVTLGGELGEGTFISAYVNIGDIFATSGDFDSDQSVEATTGSIGVLSVQGNINVHTNQPSTRNYYAAVNSGGLVSRDGSITTSIINEDGEAPGEFAVSGNIGNISVFTDLGDGINEESNAPVVFRAGGSIGNVDSRTGSIREDVIVVADVNIGTVSASGDIEGSFTAQNGSITGVQSDEGDIRADLRAGQNIGAITADIGEVKGSADLQDFDTGTLVLGVSGRILAGGNVGPITAGGGIGNYVITAGGNVLDITSNTGSVGAGTEEIVQVFQFFQTIFNGGVFPVLKTELLEVGRLTVTAGGTIGNINALKNVDGEFIARGNIGNVNAGTGIGTLSTSVDQATSFTSTEGRVGNINSNTGNIGTSGVAIVVTANGGVEIDPATLDYLPITDTNNNGVLDEANGIGNIFAETGSIWASVTTATDLGVNQASGVVIGGIAAPIGSVTVTGNIGGDLGGVSGRSVNKSGLVVGGVTGIIRSGTASTGVTVSRVITSTTPLTLVGSGYNTVVSIGGGQATVTYSLANGIVDIASITYTSDGSATSRVSVVAGASATDANKTNVGEVIVNSSVNTIAIDGSLDTLTINGNLGTPAGSVTVNGALDALTVNGNQNLTAANFIVSGVFGTVNVSGTNAGIVNSSIDSNNANTAEGNQNPQFISFAAGGGFTNVYIGKGSAAVTRNINGVIDIQLFGVSASDLIVVNTATQLSGSTPGVAATQATKDSITRLKTQAELVSKGLSQKKVGSLVIANEVDEVGTDTAGFARIGSIYSSSSKFSLKNVLIEGDVKLISVTNGLTNTTIRGEAGVVDGGTAVSGASISGSAEVIKGTKTVKSVNVAGNTAVLSSGGSMSSVFIGGSSVSVGAATMSNVQIVGSVGASIEYYGGSSSGNIGVGSAFTVEQIAKALGIAVDALQDTGDTGPVGSIVYGGLNARTTKNVVVGGAISDLVIHSSGSGSDSLFNSTIDDAYVKVGSKAFTKLNGVIGQVITAPRTIIRYVNV